MRSTTTQFYRTNIYKALMPHLRYFGIAFLLRFMGWRTIILKESEKINLFLNNMEIRWNDKLLSIPLSDIDCLIIENYKCIITTRILTTLSKNKILVIICDENLMPECQLNSFAGHHLQGERFRIQTSWSKEWKQMIWKKIIIAKILNQIDVMKMNQKDQKKSQILYEYIDEIEPGDPTNREAHAAKVYFNELFGNTFSRSSESYVNSLLNYGYTLIRAAFARAIVSKGFSPTISIFHSNKYNAFPLADDLMEPFRPIIDNYVYNNLLNRDYFSRNEKVELINILNSEIDFDGQRIPLTQAISKYVENIMLDINEEKLIFPYSSSVIYNEL